jgi:hypothetical protein
MCLLKAPLDTKAGSWCLCSLRKDCRGSRGLIVRPHSDLRYEIIGISGVFADDMYGWDYTQPHFEIHWQSRVALLFRLFVFVDDAVDEALTLVPSAAPHVSFARMVNDDDPFPIPNAWNDGLKCSTAAVNIQATSNSPTRHEVVEERLMRTAKTSTIGNEVSLLSGSYDTEEPPFELEREQKGAGVKFDRYLSSREDKGDAIRLMILAVSTCAS